MKNTVKTVITVLVVVCCGIICLAAFGYYFLEKDYLEYDVKQMISPVFTEAEAEYLGDSFQDNSQEGYSYYRLKFQVRNDSNVGREERYLNSFIFRDTDGYCDVLAVTEEKGFSVDENGCYYPPWKESAYQIVVCVRDGIREFDAWYTNYSSDETQKIHIILPQ